jgi:hypothetical protein
MLVLKQTMQQQGSDGTRAVVLLSTEEPMKKEQVEDNMSSHLLVYMSRAVLIKVPLQSTVQIMNMVMTHGREDMVLMEEVVIRSMCLNITVQIMPVITVKTGEEVEHMALVAMST